MAQTTTTFYWYDYETFGINRRSDRPAQFAGLRTGADLVPVPGPEGEGEVFYAKPALDYLPSPESSLLTGITPQRCEERGLRETEFAGAIFKRFNMPGTVSIGYNTLGFDDEVTRFLFWRNFLDPYSHSWANGCSRWDLFPLVCAVWALRGDSIKWPRWEDIDPAVYPAAEGRKGVTFKLEFLTKANGLEHGHAHDALSDVEATVALARLIAQKEPRLWQWAFENRTKDKVVAALEKGPVVWVSPKFGVVRGCTRIVMLVGQIGNDALVWDLMADPTELREIDREALHRRLFASPKNLPEGERPLPLWKLKVNASPFVCGSLAVLRPERAQKYGLDLERIRANAEKLAAMLRDIQGTILTAAQTKEAEFPKNDEEDAETGLYSGGFPTPADRARFKKIREASPEYLADRGMDFDDERFDGLLLRFRARNWPESLSHEERETWRAWCEAHVLEGRNRARTIADYFEEIDRLEGEVDPEDDAKREVLEALYAWGELVGEAASPE